MNWSSDSLKDLFQKLWERPSSDITISDPIRFFKPVLQDTGCFSNGFVSTSQHPQKILMSFMEQYDSLSDIAKFNGIYYSRYNEITAN